MILSQMPPEDKVRLLRIALQELLEALPDIPEEDCSCHISPPCLDCVEYTALRSAKQLAEDTLKETAV